MANRDEVLDKIRKLLALAESDNPHEAALALARAQALMDRHRITEAMVGDNGQAAPSEPFEIAQAPLFEGGLVFQWRVRLAMILATPNGCFIYTQRAGKGKQVCVVGKPSQIARVRYLLEFCMAETDRLAAKEAQGNGLTYANNFRLGCVDAIALAIAEERKAVRNAMQAEATSSSALVVVQNAIALVDDEARRARDFAAQAFGGFRKSKSSGSTYDGRAREHGRQSGKNIYGAASSTKLGGGQARLGPGR